MECAQIINNNKTIFNMRDLNIHSFGIYIEVENWE